MIEQLRAIRARARDRRGPGPATTRHSNRLNRQNLARIGGTLLLIGLSLSLAISSIGLDGFLNRGVVYGTPPIGGGGLTLGMNVFLEKEPDRANVVRSVQMLKDGGVTFVRQSFPWQDIEPQPGYYVQNGQSSWAKYDFIVDQLSQAGIGIMARVDTIPQWARPQTDDFKAYDKGPPQDFNNYANFVGAIAARYKGRINHFQVWNEPNLNGEWGGKPISPEQYGVLLKYTAEKVKAVSPTALIVTAGLAQTTEDGVETNNLNELDFIDRLYKSGAKPYFDILSVMDYGLGDSPEDRRVAPGRTNFSRLLLAREVMVRNGDEQKPIWVSEYGWVSLPPDWQGATKTSWGQSVDAETQARWTVEGLNRMQREWPWVTNVFVWGFRWVERPEDTGTDPSRYFEVVDHDFTPRPAYLALKAWAAEQRVATSGTLPVNNARLTWDGEWRDQTLGGQTYRVTTQRGATMRVVFQGTELRLHARASSSEGQLYATIDGQPIGTLKTDKDGSYLLLRDGQTPVHDAVLPLASGLSDGQHLLELRYGGSGEVALSGLTIGRQRPFDWTGPIMFVSGLVGLCAGLALLTRTILLALGWLRRREEGATSRRTLAWWQTRE
jgi:hypothetical protein